MRRLALALVAAVLPGAAAAHDAFGVLCPVYAVLLHSLADPGQTLVLVATGVLLARQPLATVRSTWAALAWGASERRHPPDEPDRRDPAHQVARHPEPPPARPGNAAAPASG